MNSIRFGCTISLHESKQFLYTLLGAGIMAVGVIIGQIIRPQLEAQNNGDSD